MNNIKQASIYVNKHISLQPPAKELAAELYRVIDFNRDYFSQFMEWPKFVTHPKDTADFLDSCLAKHQNNQSKNYVIMLNNHAVGMLSFNQIDQNNKTAYLGYWLDSRVQRQGIMTQAIIMP
ncbi:GNAT family N-acetyltransferase [Gilliamella sp. App6-5]|uniref:GNAT family N-acetyltransferase n=1 Tax=Gilliamella sp. App6-5 TaxID=3120232 RepID=UPI0009BCF948|nr:GNAT family N-acetyltransferase [Gilliamella apicola]